MPKLADQDATGVRHDEVPLNEWLSGKVRMRRRIASSSRDRAVAVNAAASAGALVGLREW